VAAITFFASFLWVTHSANMIVGVGSVAVISRRYGEKDIPGTELSIKETLLLKWIVAIIFGILGYLFTPIALNLLGAGGQVLDLGITYGRIIFVGLGFNFATYSVFTALRGVANPNKAMVLMISLNLINIVLDPFMIFGWWIFPEMGVAGAAVATVIGRSVGLIILLVHFISGKTSYKFRLKYFLPNLKIVAEIYRVGFSAIVRMSAQSIMIAVANTTCSNAGRSISAWRRSKS